MKKKLYVSLSVSFALTMAGFGAYKAYVPSDVAMSEQDLMVVENVLAITENGRYDIPWKALGEESCTIKKSQWRRGNCRKWGCHQTACFLRG